MLARRLINQQSTSMDAEEFMVTKLKVMDSFQPRWTFLCLIVYPYNLFVLNSKYVAMNLLEN
jgi:hypothetical protein